MLSGVSEGASVSGMTAFLMGHQILLFSEVDVATVSPPKRHARTKRIRSDK